MENPMIPYQEEIERLKENAEVFKLRIKYLEMEKETLVKGLQSAKKTIDQMQEDLRANE